MNLMFTDVKERVGQMLQDNSTTLLTAAGVVGTVATGILAWRGGYKSAEIILKEEANIKSDLEEGHTYEHTLSKTDKAKLVWPHVIPPVITGSAAAASIIMANRMSAQKAAALAAAYGLAEKQFSEYREKVEEKLTGPKAQSIDDDLAQDRVNRTPGSQQIVVVEGEVLCFDEATGRYFRGSMATINTAVNKTNEEILAHNYATASFYYDKLGLDPTTWSDEVGWNTHHPVEITISTVMSHDQRPCISIDFKYLPTVDYVTGY